jgi:Glycosyltransferase WbsX
MPDTKINKTARLIAFYLPQYHPIAENDEWWGKGFTEWTNVAKAKPMFRGHYQPHIPADLGFYDLRVPETRAAQAELAMENGIEAFCYYHYWFGGKRILERPFNEVLRSGEPDFPFCLCWANHSWTGVWAGCPGRTLIEQVYPGDDDNIAHFNTLLPAFSDDRYVTVDGKPLFIIYDPLRIPEINRLTDTWREMAVKSGLKGIYLVGMSWIPDWNPLLYGFDASTPKDRRPPVRDEILTGHTTLQWLNNLFQKISGKPTVYDYEKVLPSMMYHEVSEYEDYPCLMPNWDNTPRSGSSGLVLQGSTPELFRVPLRNAIEILKKKPLEHRLIFVKSWNEWAEGNHLEPDLRFGKAYLEVIREEIFKNARDII